MRTSRFLSTALVLGLTVAAPALAEGDGDHDPREARAKGADTVRICEDGDLVVDLVGDTTLWPPNHKYSPVDVVAQDDDGSQINLTTTLTHDEYLNGYTPSDGDEEQPEEQGSGNTINDARPFAASDTEASPNTNEHEVRSERSGRGNGRTYTVDAMASDDDGNSCSGQATVEVPHDMGNGAENKVDHTEDSEG